VLEGRAEAVVGTLNAQGWQTRCGHMRDYGAGAGAGMMRELVGRAEAVAGTLTAQNGANMLACATMGQGDQGAGGACGGGGGHDKRAGLGKHTVAACVFSSFRAHHDGSRLVHTVARRLVSLDKPGCLNTAELCQLHQFVWCRVEPRLGVQAIDDMCRMRRRIHVPYEEEDTCVI